MTVAEPHQYCLAAAGEQMLGLGTGCLADLLGVGTRHNLGATCHKGGGGASQMEDFGTWGL